MVNSALAQIRLPVGRAVQAERFGVVTAMDVPCFELEPENFGNREVVSVQVVISGFDFEYDVTACTVVRKQHIRVQFARCVPEACPLPVCLLDFSVAKDPEGFILFEESASRWFRNQPVLPNQALRLKELCCGIGALGLGALRVGFRIACQNDIREATLRALSASSSAPMVCGDIGESRVISQIWEVCPGACSIASGFACPLFGGLGDRRGPQDPRSCSLLAAWFLQAKVIILKCAKPAGEHPWVREQVSRFCSGVQGSGGDS